MAGVLVFGVFDIPLHPGHLDFLQRAARFGPVTAGLTTDELAETTKRRPVFTFDERKQSLELLGVRVVERSDVDTRPVFEQVRPAVFVCGNDWLDNNHLEAAGLTRTFLNALDILVVYTPRPHEWSSTSVLDRMRTYLADENREGEK